MFCLGDSCKKKFNSCGSKPLEQDTYRVSSRTIDTGWTSIPLDTLKHKQGFVEINLFFKTECYLGFYNEWIENFNHARISSPLLFCSRAMLQPICDLKCL